MDLEALETAVRQAVHAAGAKVLEQMLRKAGVGRPEGPVLCPKCRTVMKSLGVRGKQVQTLLGWIDYERTRLWCPHCKLTWYPGDRELGIEGTSRSPGVQRQVARMGAKEPFREVARDMEALADVRIARKDAERVSEKTGEAIEQWLEKERRDLRFQEPPPPETPKTIDTLYVEFDGTGVPMVPPEIEGRRGKQKDGSAKTREAKLGCVFTQTTFDQEGRPIRDHGSTTFVGAIEPVAQFGWRVWTEARRRGVFNAKRVVCLGDGAEWVKNTAQTHFGQAQFIVDFYHAKEHVGELCRQLFDTDQRQIERHRDRWVELLAEGDIEALTTQAQAFLPKDPNTKKDARTQIAYFEKNKDYMRYAKFKQQGLFIGSGVIEAGCKTVIGQRLKQSAMEWTVRGANAIIALRCAELSNRTEEYWEQRSA
jgi:hypothetical protein